MYWRTLVAILLLPCSLLGQNLVSNGSFVELDTCDFYGSITNIRYVKDWHSTFYSQASSSPSSWYGSTDFFTNDCGNFLSGQVPKNLFGFQEVRRYKNYGGFTHITDGLVPDGAREGIQNNLLSPLDSAVEYCFQAFISLADTIVLSEYAGSSFDVLLTDSMYTVPFFGPDYNVTPTFQVSNPSYFQDKVNWMKITGSFVANGGEQWLSISNFRHVDSLDLLPLAPNPPNGSAYYYIDDVSLYPCNTPIYTADAGPDQSGCAGDSLTFSTPYKNEEYTYFWIDAFGDTLSTGINLSVQVQNDAEYYLAQWDFKYDLTWDTVRVILDYCPELNLPNVFTPNDDGNNDLWKPIGEDIDQLELTIFSRWGQSVFQYSGSFDDFPGWNGGDATEGTYYIVLRATVLNGRVIEQKESITLLR